MRGTLAILVALAIVVSACASESADRIPAPGTTAARPAPGATTATAAATGGAATDPPRATGGVAPVSDRRRIADIPTPRSEVAAAVFRDAIYVVGGFGGPNVVERYLPGQRRWEDQPDLPIGVDHPMAAAIGTGPHAGVYVIGGNSGGRPSARVFHLRPDAPGWRELASMPMPRSAGAAVAYDERGQEALAPPPKIWVVGGASDRGLEPSTLEYDVVTDRWQTRGEIPTPRDHLAAAHFQGKICAVGGRTLSMSRNLAAFECFDAAANAWERLPAAPTARGGVGAAVIGDRLFFIGGEQPQGTFKEVEIYDARTRQWSRGPDLLTPRHGIGAAAFGNAVYVLTGGPTPGGSQTAVCEVLTIP